MTDHDFGDDVVVDNDDAGDDGDGDGEDND